MDAGVDLKGRAIRLESSVAYAPESVVSKTLLDKKAGTLTLFAFDTGQGLSEHTAPFDATVQVLDGEGDFTVDGRPILVKTGELLIMPANVPHSVRANVRFKMMLIMIRS